MDKGKKRSFNQMECSTEYVFSLSDQRNLANKMSSWQPSIHADTSLPKSIKVAALKASSYVVPLISFSGDEVLSAACGTIFEVEENTNVVMTSLNLVLGPEKSLANNLKIVVHSGECLYVAEICAYDFHYNILIIKFKSKTSLEPAKLELNLEKSAWLRPHGSKTSKTKPGDTVIVVGRYSHEPHDFMAFHGDFSMDRCDPNYYDCGELFLSDCSIHQCCDGSPLINLSGEVLGIAFYDPCFLPVLPVNIVYKWWEHYKISREKRHPSYGFDACDFYEAELATLARFVKQFPGISEGIVVREVHRAQSELLKDDVIVKCDDKSVEDFSMFWDLIWEKVGQSVNLLIARIGTPSLLTIKIPILEATKVNKWAHIGWPRRR